VRLNQDGGYTLARMPKMKTHSGAKKRFKLTKGGKGTKALARHAGKTHILQKKSAKDKRQKDRSVVVSDHDLPRVRTLLGK
jgi:large subunit ribosomal protein L35